jgi:hypothetical protein
VHPASVEDGEKFFRERFPEAVAIADPEQALYRAFGLARGSITQVAGPSIWLPTLVSLLKGNGGSLPIGDPMVLAGHFVARNGELIYAQRTTHAAEEGRWDEMIALARSNGA